MRTIGAVSTSRSDYGIYRPVLQKISNHDDLDLLLFVSGMHLSPEFGSTVREIEADGFFISERIEMLLSSDTAESIAKSMGLGMIGFAQAFARTRPDILLVLGDRFEMHSAALAALPFKIPVAHVHGGEVTVGAIDDALRHSMTKLSHLHFVATEEYARRVIQLGEDPWRVVLSGAPSLDNLSSLKLPDQQLIESSISMSLECPPLIVTYHPVTLEDDQTAWQVDELLSALDVINLPIIFTAPNADTQGRVIRTKINEFLELHSQARLIDNLGTANYFGLMNHALAMVGNSSSGIIEAPSFELPVVNIGNRQRGRTRAANVIDVGYARNHILKGIRLGVSPKFKNGLKGLANPYGTGVASEVIVNHISTTELGQKLITKQFFDIPITKEQAI